MHRKSVHHYRFTMDKKILRKRLIESRKSLDKVEKAKWDKIISEKIIKSDCFKKAEQVLVFSSTDDEFDTRYIIERCRGKPVVL